MAIHNAKLNPSFMNKILSNGVKLYADKNTTARERNIADCYAKVTRKGISWDSKQRNAPCSRCKPSVDGADGVYD